jgi:hypothetical protein
MATVGITKKNEPLKQEQLRIFDNLLISVNTTTIHSHKKTVRRKIQYEYVCVCVCVCGLDSANPE